MKVTKRGSIITDSLEMFMERFVEIDWAQPEIQNVHLRCTEQAEYDAFDSKSNFSCNAQFYYYFVCIYSEFLMMCPTGEHDKVPEEYHNEAYYAGDADDGREQHDEYFAVE